MTYIWNAALIAPFRGYMGDEDQVTYVYCASWEVFRVMQSFGVALQTALRGVQTLAKRGPPTAVASTPARRFCATRPCTLCLYWAVCRQLFGLFRAKLAILSLHAGWRWRAAQSENQLDTGRFAMKGMHSTRP